MCRRAQWGGKLAVACFVGASTTGFAAAASLAGAASLSVDAAGTELKLHFRDGAFDFLVNTLDEALRALKNELRKGRPLAIGLHADPRQTQAEMKERGLVADLLLRGRDEVATDAAMAERASINEASPSKQFLNWLEDQRWSVQELPRLQLEGAAQRSTANVLAQDDSVQRRWLGELSKHQRSVQSIPTRVCWASEAERAQVVP